MPKQPLKPTRLESKLKPLVATCLKMSAKLVLTVDSKKRPIWEAATKRNDEAEVERTVQDVLRAAQADFAGSDHSKTYTVTIHVKAPSKTMSLATVWTSFTLRPLRDARITIRLPARLRAAIDAAAADERRSLANLIVYTLEQRFLKQGKETR